VSRRTKPYRFRQPHLLWNEVIRVDAGLPTAWLDRLNRLPGVEVRSTCAGHAEDEPGHIAALVNSALAARVPVLPTPAGLTITLDREAGDPCDGLPLLEEATVRWWWLSVRRAPDGPDWWLLEAVRWLEAVVWSPRWHTDGVTEEPM
jgi:hypothetical protein